jgi:8-oxo-dGTP diphosphatase
VNERRAVSIAIHDPAHPGELLLVRRPPDDEVLPDAWGLPAASLTGAESWTDAAHRAARDKLGVDIALGTELNRGALQRPGYTLQMRLFEAVIRDGVPVVPQPVAGVTQYAGVRWGPPAELRPAADRGSLCCRLFLERADHG